MLTDFLFWGSILAAILFILYIRYIILGRLINHRIYLAQRIIEKNRDKAIRILTSVLTMEKDNPTANWLMAQIYFKSHHLILARMYLNDIIHYNRYEKDVTEPLVRETIADIFRHMGDCNKALLEYYILKKQVKLSPTAVKNAIKINLSSSRYVDAKRFMSYALRNFKEIDGELDYLMAVIEFHHADFSSSETHLKYAIDKGYPKIMDIHQLLGKIAFIRARYEDAIEFLQKLPINILETPENEDLLGQSFFFTHNYPSAIMTLEKIVPILKKKKERSMAEPVYILGCSYEAFGDLPKALETWEILETSVPFYQNAVNKLYFYSKVVTEKNLQSFIVSPTQNFIDKTTLLLQKMEYSIKEKLFEDEKTMEYLCINGKDLHPNYFTLVVVSRDTVPVQQDIMRDKMNLMASHSGKYLTYIAPMFSTEAIRFAEKNLITTYTFEHYTRNGLV